ncbi:hypothetical protein SynMEDNS5_00936 [Synechococcus sp. MEDNS5]|nr:hypothetical protein SynMEDNS5_00936 [Synechococcus sp. MEDNS5]|tara:strand:- start:508 stop:666 length:159 start_codon:yes stop_codon:yes gene_type:complete
MRKQILGQKGEGNTHQGKSRTLIAVRRNRYIPRQLQMFFPRKMHEAQSSEHL